MQIAMLLFPNLTQLDLTGPHEVLARLPGGKVHLVAKTAQPVASETGLVIVPSATFGDVPRADLVFVPGGFGQIAATDDAETLAWLRAVGAGARWVTSACTGSLLLGAAGVLDGLEATTHWLDMDDLERYGARPTGRRVVEQGKVITAAGVSSGIDMGLVLAAKIAGPEVAKVIQLGIEYDPQPPFDSGSVEKAAPETVELIRSLAAARS